MRSVRTREYMQRLEALPAEVRSAAEALWLKFKHDPRGFLTRYSHPLIDSHTGHHRPGSVSVRIGPRYRAIMAIDRGEDGLGELQYCWYWIGSHESYNKYVGTR